ncbi:purine-nucleoside phosphorylase [Kiloniella sp. b19]|uniref:purine-nucleoside phosphorylase n=1 Tax=Kiloniella sp. GXU_MW_B19 TaxID=3141326 RepID=UPI0031E00AF3
MKNTQEIKETALAAADIIRERAPGFTATKAIVLGSGLGPLVEALRDAVAISYSDLPGFPRPSVEGHAGTLHLGTLGGQAVFMMQGRSHYYESGRPDGMKTALLALRELGVKTLFLTNAAGSLLEETGPGELILIKDHINYSGLNPLIGESGSERFIDMTTAYDETIRSGLKRSAFELDIPLTEGVYMWFSGPSFETPAEINMARVLGADAVGMSTVPEVIYGRFLGMKIAGVSIVTNYAAGMNDEPLSHEQTMDNADRAAQNFQRILIQYLESLS